MARCLRFHKVPSSAKYCVYCGARVISNEIWIGLGSAFFSVFCVSALFLSFAGIFLRSSNPDNSQQETLTAQTFFLSPVAAISPPMAFPTYTLVPTVTPAPPIINTFTLVPIMPSATYTLVPAEPKIAQAKNLEDFIYFYWKLINDKDFSTAWKYQTLEYKKQKNDNKLKNFIDAFKYTKSVKVMWVKVVSVSNKSAIVDADVRFVATTGDVLNQSHRYVLVRENNIWLIDSSVKR